MQPYWKRCLLMARVLLTSWKHGIPREGGAVLIALGQLALNLLGLVTVLVVPLTAIFAPVWLYFVERRARIAAAEAAELKKWMHFADKIAAGKIE